MPLYLHSSNRTENLAQHLMAVIQQEQLSAFEKEVFLVQSMGMERWLALTLANQFGVWGNAEYLFPNRFFHNIASLIDSKLQPEAFEREAMVWRFEAALHDIEGDEFEALRAYISGPQEHTKRLQLARKLAQVFDQYQILRPQLLDSGLDQDWQHSLWQKVLAGIPEGQRLHRGELWQKLIKKLAKPQPELPKRVHIFGINSLPPLSLEVLKALSKHIQVHLYLLQPCQEYWGDAPTKAQAQQDLFAAPEMDQFHSLIIRCAQQPKELHKLLTEQSPEEANFTSYAHSDKTERTALEALQDDLLAGKETAVIEPAKNDTSIVVNSCHSRIRELEVLKDYLLNSFNSDESNLELRDIIVMAPNIADYEPFIHAVFQGSPLNYTIGDRSLRNQHELLEVFIQVIRLLKGRLEWTSVLDILEHEVVAQNLSLNPNDLDLLRHWIKQAHIRWAENDQHKAELGLPEIDLNTWSAGLNAMMQGYAMQDQAMDIEGSQAIPLGQLDYFMHQVVFATRATFKRCFSLTDWHGLLDKLAKQLFEQCDAQQLAPLNRVLAQLLELPSERQYGLDVVLDWLENAVSETKSNSGFLAGKLTFCSMLPMRAIPFKKICLLGLNIGEFPRADRSPSFDLLAAKDAFQPGDRSVRTDDRAQFLEILLSARESLYLSYIGRSIKSNEALPPSVLVSELQEVVNVAAIEHPLQAFSSQYFAESQAEQALFTYSEQAAHTANLLNQEKPASSPWWQQPIAPQDNKQIDVYDLLAFVKDPQNYFFQRVLNLRLEEAEAKPVLTEPFQLAGLDSYDINDELAKGLMSGEEPGALKDRILSSGQYLSAAIGEIAYDEQAAEISYFTEALANLPYGGSLLPNREINQQVGEYTLVGSIPHHYPSFILRQRPSSLKPKDYLQAWLIALLTQRPVYLVGLYAKPVVYTPPEEQERLTLLQQVVSLFIEGQMAPSKLWLDAAWDYALEEDEDKKLAAAIKTLNHKVLGEGERAYTPKPYNQLINANLKAEDILDDDFESICDTIIADCISRQTELSEATQ